MDLRRLRRPILATALLAAAACDAEEETSDDGGAPFDEDRGPPTAEMQALMPDGVLPLQWVYIDGQWQSGWRIADATTGDEQTRPATSEVYVFCADGTYDACPLETPPVGDNVFATIPRDADYSPYWQVVKVRVPDDHEPDSIKSVATIQGSGYEIEPLPMIVNCPVHGLTATLEGDGVEGYASVPGKRAWYEGYRVYYWDFGPLPFAAGSQTEVASASGYLAHRPGEQLPASEPARGEDLNGDGDAHDTGHVFSLVPFAPDVAAGGGRIELRAVDVDPSLALATDGAPEDADIQTEGDVDAAIEDGLVSLRAGGEIVEVWNFGLRRSAP